jgi:hypothetical protein
MGGEGPKSTEDIAQELEKIARNKGKEAVEGKPTKAERAYKKAFEDFKSALSPVDISKISDDVGQLLAMIFANALIAIIAPLRMGAAKLGATEKKDEILDAIGVKAKEAAGNLWTKLQDVYKNDHKKDEFLSISGGAAPITTAAKMAQENAPPLKPEKQATFSSNSRDLKSKHKRQS